jgi:hypothetical protein
LSLLNDDTASPASRRLASGPSAPVTRCAPFFSSLLVAASVIAERTVSLGEPNTFIDVSHPATTTGVLSRFAIRWRKGPNGDCAGAYTFKVLRPGTVLGTWTVVRTTAPIGSEVADAGIDAMQLTVKPGDVLAVTVLKPLAQCGSVLLTPDPGATTYYFKGDIQDNVAPVGVVIRHGWALNVVAVDKTRAYATLPVVGSAEGANSSFFRTAMQFTNPSNEITAAKLVFHPAGQSAKPTDPSYDVFLAPGFSAYFPDVVKNQLKTSGLGSLDILAILPPVITARVYNDGGTAGTQGFTEEIVTSDGIMRAPQQGTLPYPGDPTNFRINVGVRTFDDGATVSFTLYSSTGTMRRTEARTYGPNSFEQFGASTLGASDGWMVVYVTQGSAIVYGSYTDNRTNDSSLRYATAN